MNVPATEEQIRALAYQLWEDAGNPEGKSDDFWLLAQQQLAGEPEIAESDVPASSEKSSEASKSSSK